MTTQQFEEKYEEETKIFIELTKGFKPEFGNEKHIKVGRLIAENNKSVAKMKEIMGKNATLQGLRSKILDNKVKINYLLKE